MFDLRQLVSPLTAEKAIPMTLVGLGAIAACLLIALLLVTWASSSKNAATAQATATTTQLAALGPATLTVPTFTPPAFATVSTIPSASPTPSPAQTTPGVAPTADGLERAKRGTVYIAVPLDSAPGRIVSGSGSVITERGHILTNNHLFVDDNGKPYNTKGKILIGFPPRDDLRGRVEYYYQAVLDRADAQHDLALIRITANVNGDALPADLGLNVIPIGDSDKVESGDQVTILGYPGLGGDTLTLTRGTVSGFLPDEGFIKTDAEINPGNSGGPAFNAAYEQIGISSAVFVSKSQTIPGKIGWIRPVNFAKPLVDLAKREAGE
jgi:putative serine protease PepD